MKANLPTAAELAASPAVQRAMGFARDAARGTAARLPRPAEQRLRLRPADLSGVRATDVLVDGVEARVARRRSRALHLPRTLDDTSAWAAFGALAALLRIVDDGRRTATVIDTTGSRSVFSRWITKIGFAPVHVDVTRPEVVGETVDPRSVDMVARLYPHLSAAETVDEDLARGSAALRRGGVMSVTVRLGPQDEGGVGMPELRSLIARADEQGLSLVGDLDISDSRRAREAQAAEGAASFGVALLTFRRR